jgi:hypothetical protein
MKTATFLGLAMALAGAFPSESQVATLQLRQKQALVATNAGLPEAARQPILSGSQTVASENGSQQVRVDPQVLGVENEFQHAEAPEEYGKARAHALALMADADAANNALIGFQSAVIAADCTYFSSPEAQQSPNEVWAEVEARDLHEAALRYTDAVKQNWFESRRWYERYANRLAASAKHIMVVVLSVVRPDLKILLQQLGKV